MPYFEPITTTTRLGKCGRLVSCPHCKHVARVYALSFSALGCQNCKQMVNKYQWSIGPAVTPQQQKPSRMFKAQRGKSAQFAKTKKELLPRLSHPVAEYTITRETIPGWTRPDLVLIISRKLEATVNFFSNNFLLEGHSLEWCDSSGSRSVFLHMVNGEQQDMPHRTFQEFKAFLAERDIKPDLIMHREDPGLGIYLPELDEASYCANQ